MAEETQPTIDQTDDNGQTVSGLVKWTFVLFMMGLTALFGGVLIFNFNKVVNPGKINEKEFTLYLDSLKNDAIHKAAADSATTNLDSLKKIILNPSQSISTDLMKTYLKNHKGPNPDEKQFHRTLMLLVGCTGALGSMIFILSSFVTFWGNRKLERSWLAWYAAKPFIGMGLAILTYLAMRAGFFSSSVGAGDINIYGVLAISGMVGLFTDEATLKLKEIFEVVFKTDKDDRKGQLSEDKSKTTATVTTTTASSATTVTGAATAAASTVATTSPTITPNTENQSGNNTGAAKVD